MLYRNRRQQVNTKEDEIPGPVEQVDVKLLNDDGLKLVLSRINFLQQQFSNYLNQKHHDKQMEKLTAKMSELSNIYEKQIEDLKDEIKNLKMKSEPTPETPLDKKELATENLSYNFATSKLVYAEGSRINKPDMTVYFREYVKRKFDLTRTQEKMSPTDIANADERFKFIREKICTHCRKAHRKGCCKKYTSKDRTTTEYFLNVELSS